MRIFEVKDSSSIHAFAYDPHEMILRIWFTNGNVGDYEEVPPERVGGFIGSASMGRFLAINIKPQYKYNQLRNELP